MVAYRVKLYFISADVFLEGTFKSIPSGYAPNGAIALIPLKSVPSKSTMPAFP